MSKCPEVLTNKRFWCVCFPLKVAYVILHSKNKMFQQGLFVSIFTAYHWSESPIHFSEWSSNFFGFPPSFDRCSSLPIFDACCRLVLHLVVSTDVLSTYTTYTGPIPKPYLYPKLCQKTHHIPRTYTGTIELLPWRSWESRKYLPYKCICKRKILLLPGLGFRGYTWLYMVIHGYTVYLKPSMDFQLPSGHAQPKPFWTI